MTNNDRALFTVVIRWLVKFYLEYLGADTMYHGPYGCKPLIPAPLKTRCKITKVQGQKAHNQESLVVLQKLCNNCLTLYLSLSFQFCVGKPITFLKIHTRTNSPLKSAHFQACMQPF